MRSDSERYLSIFPPIFAKPIGMAQEQYRLGKGSRRQVPCRKRGHFALLLVAMLLSGCPHLISLDYVPSNPYIGQRQVGVDRFEYLPFKRGELGLRHVETNPQAPGKRKC